MREGTVIGPFRRLRASGKSNRDLQQGDFVRIVGQRHVGWVESVDTDNLVAVVAWHKDRRDILPVGMLRKIDPRGHDLDQRKRK